MADDSGQSSDFAYNQKLRVAGRTPRSVFSVGLTLVSPIKGFSLDLYNTYVQSLAYHMDKWG